MVYDVETNSVVKLKRFSISPSQPYAIMKPQAPPISARIPRVQPSGDIQPVKTQIAIRVAGKKFLDGLPIMWIGQNPNLIPPRQVPRPIPREAGFRTQSWAASMSNHQYFHVCHRLP